MQHLNNWNDRQNQNRRRWVGLAILFVWMVTMTGSAWAQAPWPFERPSLATLRASNKKVFAHYFTPFPVSIDNNPFLDDWYTKNFLSPYGEPDATHPNGKYYDAGGFTRERPLYRAVRTESNWVDLDFQDEVRRAVALGLDGFTCDILSYSTGTSDKNWTSVKKLMDAANAVDTGFKVVIMPDMQSGTFNVPSDANLTAAVSELSAKPAAYKLSDGRLVVSPYNAQTHTAAWWSTWLAKMHAAPYNLNIALVPVFQSWKTHAADFQSISAGISDWGNRSPGANVGWSTAAAEMHAYCPIAMLPVSPQDFRPRSKVYQEAGNSLNYRTMWQNAISPGGTATQKADWVQLCTWNDYSESTEISPSTGIQYSFYDLTAYYTAWFKTGVQPPITRDVLYYFHRSQSVNASRNTTQQPVAFAPGAGSDTPVDQIELLAFLTQPGTLKIQFGGQTLTKSAPAGITSFIVPFTVADQGKPTFSLVRGSTTVFNWRSATEITNSIIYQDFLYRGGSNNRAPDNSMYIGQVNFQPSTAATPANYQADTGLAYGVRPSTNSFGWLLNGTATANNNTRERNDPASPDKRYDTLDHMQVNIPAGLPAGTSYVWEMAVPNGIYKVHVVCGDPSNFDGTYKLNVEGVLTVDGAQNSVTPIRWVEGTKTVMVSDGKLTLTCGSGSLNTKICYLDITQY